MKRHRFVPALAVAALCTWPSPGFGQSAAPAAPATQTAPAPAPSTQAPAAPRPAGAATAPAGVTPPPGFVIGAEDQLHVVFWREESMSAEVVVRPDGMISLPLLNDVQAAGLTPDQLRVSVTERATKFIEEPTVTVVVKAINSRRIYITGQVNKPGPYALGGPTTVLQMLATAGGVLEFADSEKILIIRTENGRQVTHRFNYKDIREGKNLAQNIELKPGDTILIP